MKTEERARIMAKSISAIGMAIRELGSIPSGHLYAQVMGHLSLEDYEFAISVLEVIGKVKKESNHMLVWIG